MFEFIALGAVALGLYYVLGSHDSKELSPATLDKRFEDALAAVVADKAIFIAGAGVNPDPTGAPPSDAEVKTQTERAEGVLRKAWLTNDPHEIAGAAAEMRSVLVLDLSVESKKKLVALSDVMRDKIQTLSGQGDVMQGVYDLIDKMDAKQMKAAMSGGDMEAAKGFMERMKKIEEGINTIDIAALQPYTATIDDKSIMSASNEVDGVVHPVFQKVHLYTLSTSQRIDTPVSVELKRYVKQVTSKSGAVASVFIGVVTTGVPPEYYNKQIYVFAPVGIVKGMEPTPFGGESGEA